MELKIGQHVKFRDQQREVRDALVTCIHINLGDTPTVADFVTKYGKPPSINVVVVQKDEARSDNYGRQTEHHTSVPFKDPIYEVAGGFYWFIDE